MRKHMHKAAYDESGKLTDDCAECGKNCRDYVHFRNRQDQCEICGYSPEGSEAETIVFFFTKLNHAGPYCGACIEGMQEEEDQDNRQLEWARDARLAAGRVRMEQLMRDMETKINELRKSEKCYRSALAGLVQKIEADKTFVPSDGLIEAIKTAKQEMEEK